SDHAAIVWDGEVSRLRSPLLCDAPESAAANSLPVCRMRDMDARRSVNIPGRFCNWRYVGSWLGKTVVLGEYSFGMLCHNWESFPQKTRRTWRRAPQNHRGVRPVRALAVSPHTTTCLLR